MNNQRNVNNNSLLEQIRALSFAKVELELYLDTHPECRAAIDYYHKTVNELKELMELYNNTNSPIRAEGVASNDEWTWVNTPWPWQEGAGAPSNVR